MSIGQWAKGGLVLGGVQKGMDLLGKAVRGGISEFQQSQKVTAQTVAVLKSTRQAANISAKGVDNLATTIMKYSGVDDEAIKSGENLLLTFTNVRNGVGRTNQIFSRATVLASDMSVALGEDLKSANIQLGKALNDPIKGITALSRVGVSFTKQQKDQIKTLVDSGRTMDAQKVILKELNKEFGGSAKAAGETLGGQINVMRERFNNWSGDMVAKTIPILKETISWLRDHWPEIRAKFLEMWASVKPTLVALGQLVATVVGLIRKHWGTIGPIVQQVANIIKTNLKIMGDVLKIFTALLRGDWTEAWNQAKNLVRDVITAIKQRLVLAKDTLGAAALAVGKGIVQGLIAGLEAIPGLLEAAVKGLFHKVIQWAKDALGIKSPSTVFHGIGVNMIQGMIKGVGSMGSYLKDAVVKLAKSVPSRAFHAFTGSGGGGDNMGGLKPQVWRAVNYARSKGWAGDVTSGFRTYAEQSKLYWRYLHGGPLAAAPGSSSHESGSAVDVTDYGTFGRIMAHAPSFEKLYNYLGARDPVHFSISGYGKGGIFTRPTLGVIGEAGPEAVIPLSRGGGRPMQVNLQLDGRTLASLLVDPLRNEARMFQNRTGRAAF